MIFFLDFSDFTVRDSPPQRAIPISTSPTVMTPKEKKDPVSQSFSLPGSFPNSDGWGTQPDFLNDTVERVDFERSTEIVLVPLVFSSDGSVRAQRQNLMS